MLTPQEKVKTRHHLGYLNVVEAYTFVLGIPSAVQTQFTVEGAMERILADAEPEFRRQLGVLDLIERQRIEDLELLATTRIGNIELRADEHKRLTDEYHYWRKSLANMMGIAPNPFDQRFVSSGVNVSVQH